MIRFAMKLFYDIVCSDEQKAQILEHLKHLESSSKLHFPDRSLGPALEELRELLAAKVGPH